MKWNISSPNKDGLVSTPGIETGKVEWWYSNPLGESRLKEGSIIVLKFHGGMHWSARGQQAYGAAHFAVFQVEEIKDAESRYYNKLYVCEPLIEFPIRKEKK